MKSARRIVLLSIALIVMWSGTAGAMPYETEIVTGNTYTCYFLSSLDIVSTNITFDEKGWMTFARALSLFRRIGL